MVDCNRRGVLKGAATLAVAGGSLAVANSTGAATDTDTRRVLEDATGWSGYRGDQANTGAVGADHGFEADAAFDALEHDWGVDAEGLPAVVDDTVYLTDGGTVRALDADDGSTEWHSDDVGAEGVPTVADGTVYVRRDGGVTALDAANGTVAWDASVADDAVGQFAVASGHVFVAGDGALHALDREAGSSEWSRDEVAVTTGDSWEDEDPVGHAFETEAVVVDEYVFAVLEEGTIVGVDPETGETAVTIETDHVRLFDLTAADGRVFARTGAETVVAYDATTGEDVGRWDGAFQRLAVRGETLVYVTPFELVAVDLASGDRRWTVGNYSQAIGDPVIAGDAVLVEFGEQGDEYANSVAAFALEDGSERWSRSLDEPRQVGGRCVVADQTIYLEDGGLSAIRANGDDDTDEPEDDEQDGPADENADDEASDNAADHAGSGADERDPGPADDAPAAVPDWLVNALPNWVLTHA